MTSTTHGITSNEPFANNAIPMMRIHASLARNDHTAARTPTTAHEPAIHSAMRRFGATLGAKRRRSWVLTRPTHAA